MISVPHAGSPKEDALEDGLLPLCRWPGLWESVGVECRGGLISSPSLCIADQHGILKTTSFF